MTTALDKMIDGFFYPMLIHARKKFKTPLRSVKIEPTWNGSLAVKSGVTPRKGPFIQLDMNRVFAPVTWLAEHDEFASDPVIGNIYCDKNPELNLLGTLAHQFAHVIDKYNLLVLKTHRDKNPHGAFWKNYYSELRQHFVNPYLSPAPEMPINIKDMWEKEITQFRISMAHKMDLTMTETRGITPY